MRLANLRPVTQATIVGLAVALAFSMDELISLKIWVGATIVWLAGTQLVRMLQTAMIEPATLRVLWRQRSSGGRDVDRRPSELRSVEVLLSTSTESPRAAAFRLGPRLRSLAEHSFRDGGIEIERNHDRVRAALGDVAWLIDPAPGDRAPTLAEIDRFLDRLDDMTARPSTLTPAGEQ